MSRINVANFRHPDGTDDNITLDSSGRVGLGTSSPAAKLDVSGNVQFGDGGGFDMNANGTRWQFSLAGTERMRIDSSGKVGIGTGSPSEALTVSGKVQATTEFKSETGNDLRLNAGSANRDIFMQVNGSTLMTVQGSTGNVGIGTASPQTLLHVADNSPVLRLQDTAAAGSPFSQVSGNNGNLFLLADDGNNFADTRIQFDVDGTERARIDSSGNFKFNSGYGSVATAYGCRAWVNFNGTGTVSIRASGNVSSITDSGTGKYRANFTNSMPDAYYAAEVTVIKDDAADNNDMYATIGATGVSGRTPTTTYVPITTTRLNTALVDCPVVNVVIIR
jgi:hypothetical protein